MTKPMLHRLRTLPLALAVTLGAWGWAGASQAQSLVDLYQSAREYDAAFRSARAQFEANLARADQARAGTLPTANLSAGMSRSALDIDLPATDRSYGTRNMAVSASQPLYRPANWATHEQGKKQVYLAQEQLRAAEQDLIVRVTQAYFDVLASQDSLAFVAAQKAAVAEQLAAAKRNFEVGTSTITDTREAQARYDLVIAQEIAAENDLRVKRIALDQLVGRSGTQPKGLAAPVALPTLTPSRVDDWVGEAERAHPSVQQAQISLDVAELETQKAKAGHLPTVDAVASYSITRNINGSASAAVDNQVRAASLGVNLNVPLFAGFATQNRIRETLALEDKSRSDLENARRNVSQATRTAYFGVVSGMGQVKALEAAEASSQSALDANKLGYQVGVRINIDVLNSQSQLFQTKRDLARARYDVLVGNLRLRQANGTLKAEDLDKVNTLLVK